MQGKRSERVSELIRKELSSVLLNQIRDPRLGFVTVTRVEVSNDLQHARVFYSVLGKEVDKAKTKEALERARGFLQRDIAAAVNLRYTPHLNFILDESFDRHAEIEGILKKIQVKEPPPGEAEEETHE